MFADKIPNVIRADYRYHSLALNSFFKPSKWWQALPVSLTAPIQLSTQQASETSSKAVMSVTPVSGAS